MTSLLLDILYETYSQAPPPSKDFHLFTITKTEIIWKSWSITLRTGPRVAFPRETRRLHEEFVMNEQQQILICLNFPLCFSEQLQRVFGKNVLEYALNLCYGHYDFLVRMPDNLLIHIFSFLDLDDIRQLSKTCKKFQKMCNSEEFWEKIKTLQNKSDFDIKRVGLMVYKKLINFHQNNNYQRQPKQRRQTAFF
ncbi:F-box only protein 36-like [Sarcophilus harrisii]|uniref:F-box only protein 36-like n=1 Tax=Sarcophilus harrisii TaxID=9305 RepID=UPI0013019CBB|nr:F-box only protein 36-like [Sarcophilus harrisii]